MLQFNNCKQQGLRAVWVIVAVLLVVGCKHAKAVAESLPSGESLVRVMKQSPEGTLAINLVYGKILRGDFESAQEIVSKPTASDSKGLRELRKVIDEYMAIKTRRKALQHKGYQTQINKLKKLRQKAGPIQLAIPSKRIVRLLFSNFYSISSSSGQLRA